MSHSLPLPLLIGLAQDRTDAASRKLSELRSVQTSAAEKLEMLIEYRREYNDHMQARVKDGVTAAQWGNFQHFIGMLDNAIEHQRELALHAEARLAHGKSEWQHCKRRQNAFDTLADRSRQQEMRALGKREQREGDEHAARQHRIRTSTTR